MATDTTRVTVSNRDQNDAPPAPAREIYDRSSLTGDFMVMLADQTSEDFERYAPASQVCEYLNGIVYMPSPATDRHQEQVQFVFHLLDGFRCERGAGQVLTAPAVLRLAPQWKPEPDLFVRPPAGARGVQPPAVLVVEFLSPSTRHHDLGIKLETYRTFAIPEIWMFDDRDHVLRASKRVGPGDRYVEEVVSAGPFDSYALPSFWIDVSWLWNDPLPNARRCLDQILAGPPAPQS
jgi:Uma2 family endonuclease